MCKFIDYIKAGSPVIWVRSHEECRVIEDYVTRLHNLTIKDLVVEDLPDAAYTTYSWDIISGLRQINARLELSSKAIDGTEGNPINPLNWLRSSPDALEYTVLFMKDYHAYLNEKFRDHAQATRMLRNLVNTIREKHQTIVIVSPILSVPEELKKEVRVIEYGLPTTEDLDSLLTEFCTTMDIPKPTNSAALVSAARGLTLFEAEESFAASLASKDELDENYILGEKQAIIKNSGRLEVVTSDVTLADIGAGENVKEYIAAHADDNTEAARQFGVTPSKGLVLGGVSGCGKSMFIKALANAWHRPLLRLDTSMIYGRYVGESENNARDILALASAFAPGILWIDEGEKGFGGGSNGQDTHETSKHVMQLFLTFMQERTADVYIAMTANSLDTLPREFLRSGRIDAKFWVDLPDAEQREDIIKIHLHKKNRSIDNYRGSLVRMIQETEGFSGADIETWINEALSHAWKARHEDLMATDLLETISAITPASRMNPSGIQRDREKAKEMGFREASIIRSAAAAPVKVRGSRRVIVS